MRIVDYHAEDLSRLERLLDEFLGIVAVKHDVHLLALKFLGHGVDSGLLGTDACADCVNIGIVADNRDLGTGSGSAAGGLDLHGAVVNFRAFQLEQTLDKSLISTGNTQ